MLLCMKDSCTSYYNFVSHLSECQTFNQHSNTLQFIQEISIIKTVALNMCDVILDMYQYITLLFGTYSSYHLYGGLNSTKLIPKISLLSHKTRSQ